MPCYHKIYILEANGNRKRAPTTKCGNSFNGKGSTGITDKGCLPWPPGLREDCPGELTSELQQKRTLVTQKRVVSKFQAEETTRTKFWRQEHVWLIKRKEPSLFSKSSAPEMEGDEEPGWRG